MEINKRGTDSQEIKTGIHHHYHHEHNQGLGLKNCSFKAQAVLGLSISCQVIPEVALESQLR
jgi:hypothetical protein